MSLKLKSRVDTGLINLLLADFEQLLANSGHKGVINPSAYDTAWVARLTDSTGDGKPLFPQALKWLARHQHADGSWGEGGVVERLLATSAAVLALAERGGRASDREQLEKGLRFLWRSLAQVEQTNLDILPIGFELLIGALAEEGLELGLNFPTWLASRFENYRQQKLALLSGLTPAQFRSTTAVFSLEFLGAKLPDVPESFVDEGEGGVRSSPAATASVLRFTPEGPARQKMLNYLLDNEISGEEGSGWGDHSRFDLFEAAWVLYNLQLCGQAANPQFSENTDRLLEQLARQWQTGNGIGAGTGFLADSDDSAVAYTVLKQAGAGWIERYGIDLAGLEQFWRKPKNGGPGDYLVTYQYERDPSLSANVHGLQAYHQAGQTEKVARLLAFIENSRPAHQPFWLDKWHVSPYYATAHVILATAELRPDLTDNAIAWLLYTQLANGGWGLEERPSTEETALGLQALAVYSQVRGWNERTRRAASRAAHYLRRNYRPYVSSYTPLWIGKNRYAPQLVVRSTVLSALVLAELHQL